MTVGHHEIIRVEFDASNCAARARCACGVWRQAGAWPAYPGRAGAILQAVERFECGSGPLSDFRAARPFPADPQSVEAAASELERKSADLRTQAAALLAKAAEYEAGSEQLRPRGERPAEALGISWTPGMLPI